MESRSGPLAGVIVLELGGIGPVPFAGMMLADLGATVIRVERAGESSHTVLNRGRTTVVVDLKDPEGAGLVRRIADGADILIEGFRPGVTERLGLGPDDLRERNRALVYGRMTGWGQDGPWADAPGHDINYLSVTGALHAIGPAGGDPVPPLNLVGDFGGGGMLLAYGVVCALLSARISGEGQVVDAAMVDGTSLLMGMVHGLVADGHWRDERGANLIDGGAPFYRTYRCADGAHMAVGCIEPQFYRDFLRVLGLTEDPTFAAPFDRTRWTEQARRLEEVFATRPRAHWAQVFEGSQACTTPVLSLGEAAGHQQLAARGTLVVGVDGVLAPMPAPRFSGTPPAKPQPPSNDPSDVAAALQAAGLSQEEIVRARTQGVLAAHPAS
ncbi:MAG TPA: CaiB/BaiF CoA-transferase family protein [Candidatus Nanopelagicales bacterium]|nr:CaiB/BaiF CoA-transferase family protein [Candidatus Nanopelagicales bacterium]